MTATRPEHDGPCRINLDVRIGGCRLDSGEPLTVRAIAERAFVWADGLDEFAELLATAREATTGRGLSEISREQFDALQEVMQEFVEYAAMCGYGDDEDFPDDALIGKVTSMNDRTSTWLHCEVPVTWTETVRRGHYRQRTETREYRALAHT